MNKALKHHLDCKHLCLIFICSRDWLSTKQTNEMIPRYFTSSSNFAFGFYRLIERPLVVKWHCAFNTNVISVHKHTPWFFYFFFFIYGPEVFHGYLTLYAAQSHRYTHTHTHTHRPAWSDRASTLQLILSAALTFSSDRNKETADPPTHTRTHAHAHTQRCRNALTQEEGAHSCCSMCSQNINHNFWYICVYSLSV